MQDQCVLVEHQGGPDSENARRYGEFGFSTVD
ncbi:Uncharacterised protein [Mycobacterium tuberculosis]|nr:Uncharacterised protein [Mycobacterium tuberculosis]